MVLGVGGAILETVGKVIESLQMIELLGLQEGREMGRERKTAGSVSRACGGTLLVIQSCVTNSPRYTSIQGCGVVQRLQEGCDPAGSRGCGLIRRLSRAEGRNGAFVWKRQETWDSLGYLSTLHSSDAREWAGVSHGLFSEVTHPHCRHTLSEWSP